MKTLRKIDIESMETELQVLASEKQSSIVGGIFTTSCDPTTIRNDCSLSVVAYLTGQDIDTVKNQFATDYANEYFDAYGTTKGKDWNGYYNDAMTKISQGNLTSGVTDARVVELLNECGSSEYKETDVKNKYDSSVENSIIKELSSAGSGNAGIYAGLVISGNGSGSTTINHSVAITGYNSGTFTYYDPQNNCTGTFNWEDLNHVIM